PHRRTDVGDPAQRSFDSQLRQSTAGDGRVGGAFAFGGQPRIHRGERGPTPSAVRAAPGGAGNSYRLYRRYSLRWASRDGGFRGRPNRQEASAGSPPRGDRERDGSIRVARGPGGARTGPQAAPVVRDRRLQGAARRNRTRLPPLVTGSASPQQRQCAFQRPR